MKDALLILLYVLGFGAAIAINWLLWFVLMPILFRLLRDQIRQRRKSN
jgi:hypothetical protein